MKIYSRSILICFLCLQAIKGMLCSRRASLELSVNGPIKTFFFFFIRLSCDLQHLTEDLQMNLKTL